MVMKKFDNPLIIDTKWIYEFIIFYTVNIFLAKYLVPIEKQQSICISYFFCLLGVLSGPFFDTSFVVSLKMGK